MGRTASEMALSTLAGVYTEEFVKSVPQPCKTQSQNLCKCAAEIKRHGSETHRFLSFNM